MDEFKSTSIWQKPTMERTGIDDLKLGIVITAATAMVPVIGKASWELGKLGVSKLKERRANKKAAKTEDTKEEK